MFGDSKVNKELDSSRKLDGVIPVIEKKAALSGWTGKRRGQMGTFQLGDFVWVPSSVTRDNSACHTALL